jgi:transglutaminase-like putative cysteine protease
VADPGTPDIVAGDAGQHAVEHLPEDALVFLLGSRYCETDRLSEAAWALFGGVPPGWQRVQSICDFVHGHILFGYEHARPTKSAWETYREQTGVCRDFAHLAVTFCRCMNIPARYCTGYLGDIGEPPTDAPMDFSAWFEAYLGGRWYTLDARHNRPRIGRIVMARGRDATDVAIVTSFGPCTLTGFKVKTDEVVTTREAGAEAVARHAIEAQVSQDAERLIGDWNERQARRMPLLFAPTTGAAFAARSCEYDAWPAAPPKRSTRTSSTAPLSD